MTMCEYGNLPKGKTNDQIKIDNLEREAQGLRSANARYKMEVQLAHSMLEDFDYEKTVGDVEHETELHDRIESLITANKKLEEGFDEVCEALDRQTQRLIERDHKLNKAIDLLADVVATRELERESYNLHNKIEDFINE